MGRVSVALFFLFLVFLCFPISSNSQRLNPSTSLLNQEQAHGDRFLASVISFVYMTREVKHLYLVFVLLIAEVTIKDIKGGEDDQSIDIFRAGKGGHGVTGGRGGGRKASPKKRNAAMDRRPSLFFSATSVLFTGFIMFSFLLTCQ